MADQLEIAAQGLTAMLATWLGLTVAIRAGGLPAARIFGVMTLFLVTWSVAIIIQRFSDVSLVDRVANGFEELGAVVVIAAIPHIAVAISVEGRWSRMQKVTVIGGYVLAFVMGLPAVVNPDAKFAVAPPHFEFAGLPGELFGWAWILARMLLFGLAITWLVLALRRADRDIARRRQLQVALLTIGLGVLGGIVRFTPPLSDTDPWLGVSLITLAIVVAAYAVFAQRIFFSANVAARSYRTSVVAGLVVTGYVGAILAADRLVRNTVGVELPIVTALALVATIALFEPVSDRIRGWLAGRSGREDAYWRLLRALGESVVANNGSGRTAQPALARLTRAFRLSGAYIRDASGHTVASHGEFDRSSPLALEIPLISEGRAFGTIVFGPKRSNLPYAAAEVELLRHAASYLAQTEHMTESEWEQVAALDRLSGQRKTLASAGSRLEEALGSSVNGATADRFHVFALGPLRVERSGRLVRQFGGAKAGTRQAEAVFAFLYDRGEQGVAKDEIIELIWPDVDLERADLAFHRTLGGLRNTLEPGRRSGHRNGGIAFHNDRYRLDPSLVAWSDVDAFEEELAAAGAADEPDVALPHLERARSLYRGDYLDDCPFYGDSAQVEERRELLRGRYVDLLLALGEHHEARGDRPTAASCFREARAINGQSLPPADEALTRLGVAT